MGEQVFTRISLGNLKSQVKIGKKIPKRRAIEFNLISTYHKTTYLIRGKELFELVNGKIILVQDKEKALSALKNAKWKPITSFNKMEAFKPKN
jgi:hypothetical protein